MAVLHNMPVDTDALAARWRAPMARRSLPRYAALAGSADQREAANRE
jgi:hypothetical protein